MLIAAERRDAIANTQETQRLAQILESAGAAVTTFWHYGGHELRSGRSRRRNEVAKRQRLGCPCGIEFGCEGVFVLEPPEALSRRLFSSWCQHQDRRRIASWAAEVRSQDIGIECERRLR